MMIKVGEEIVVRSRPHSPTGSAPRSDLRRVIEPSATSPMPSVTPLMSSVASCTSLSGPSFG